MSAEVSVGVLWLVIGIAGFLIVTMVGIIGFFGRKLISEFREAMTEMKRDIKSNTEEAGKNKGRIELVEQQQLNDIKRIEENTQQKLDFMALQVGDLASSVKLLIFGKTLDDKDA
jgi:hypothetical protein